MLTKIVATVLAAGVLLGGAGCKRRERARVQQTEEEGPQLASTVHMGDPRAATQLVSGFYGIEQNSWRWTAGKFAVVLRPPRGSAQKGAVLRLKLAVPDAVIAKLKAVSLSATIGGTALTPETFTQAGEFTYQRDVPGSLLAGDAVKVEFALDKSLAPGSGDQRELGVIATSAGLEGK